MIDEFLRRYAISRDRKSNFELRTWADQRLTPIERAELRERGQHLSSEFIRWLDRFDTLPPPRRKEPQNYVAREVAAGISLYSSYTGRLREKALILAFASFGLDVNIPVPWFLQYLDSDRFDIILLQDPGKAHFAFGLPPYASSLCNLLTDLDDDFQFSAYDALFCCGFSMGGLPSLRAAVLTRADRAVSFGGRKPWEIRRLLNRQELPAFDPLCECVESTATELVCVYCADHELDREHAEKIAQTVSVRRLAVAGSDSHNSVYELAKAGTLQSFLDAMFDVTIPLDEIDLQQLTGIFDPERVE